jgi:hypothetical protein
MALEIWTCEASVPVPSTWAEFAIPLATAAGATADWDATGTGQRASTPEAAAAVRTVEPVTAIVSLEGFPCRGV